MIEQSCGRPTCLEAHARMRMVDVMLSEANHRIANFLQAIMAASMATAGRTCAESSAARDRLTTRIAAIATLHRMLSVSADAGLVSFGDYLDELIANLGRLWGGTGAIRISAHHTKEVVDADAAVRIGMIVNELVTNSCKYAYADTGGGEIRVGFSTRDGSFVLIVADDGCGIPSEPKRLGMGTRLITELARRLGATFAYQPARPGTIAVVTGPADALRSSSQDCRGARPRLDARDQIIDVTATVRA